MADTETAWADPAIATDYYLSDNLGTTQTELSSGGWPVWQTQYAPFGQEITQQPTANNYKFTGFERDPESSLDHATFRQYAFTTGRWMSPDPYDGSMDFGNPQSLNRYAYVGNNPLSFTDPSGLFTLPVPPIDPVEIGIDVVIGAAAIGEFVEGLFYHPQFHRSTQPRPGGNPSVTQDANGTYTMKVYSNLYTTGSTSGYQYAFLLAGVAPSSACIVVNGQSLCKSPVDRHNFLHGRNTTHYRDNKPGCSTHVVIDNKTGQITDNHIDEYNPNYDLFLHGVLDVAPDLIFKYVTGSYIVPAGRSFCQP